MRGERKKRERALLKDWRERLPFYRQGDVDGAIESFKAIIADPRQSAESVALAKGWLSYSYLTVLLDGWAIRPWGDAAKPTPAALERQARSLAKDAIAALPAHYDTNWAYGFLQYYDRNPEGAAQAFRTAIESRPDQVTDVLAEAADIFVYLGQLDQALRLIAEAIGHGVVTGQAVPDWYHWVAAWVLFNKGLASRGGEAAAFYSQSRAALRRMCHGTTERRYDYDCLLLLAAIKLQDSQENGGRERDLDERDEALNAFLEKIRSHRRKAGWSSALEINRARYQGEGEALLPRWSAIVETLLDGRRTKKKRSGWKASVR